MAVSLWQLVFSQVRLLTNPKIVEILVMMTLFQEEPALLKKWLHFLEKHPQVIFKHNNNIWVFPFLRILYLSERNDKLQLKKVTLKVHRSIFDLHKKSLVV